MPYDPTTHQALTFFDALPRFETGADTPRDYLERCLEVIDAREPVVQAFVSLNLESARSAADESSERWRRGRALSPVDGMPISIKDLLETKDMPTQMGCEAFAGHFPRRDNAAVWALRDAGAVILGKTVTAELGGAHPGATTNPFDASRTPGGSSSGSAAAVAAGMVPAALGSQVGGSIIRPSGYCGNVSLKPTQGAINRGERQATSMSTHGVHAGCAEDMWQVAIEIAKRAGGDRGCRGLLGPDEPPRATPVERLIVLETAGWSQLDSSSQSAFEGLIAQLEAMGITVLRRADHRAIEDFERAIENAAEICSSITGWENRWNTRNLVDQFPGQVSERAKLVLEKSEQLTPADYEHYLSLRAQAQIAHVALAGLADAAVTLSCPGPAPLWNGDTPGEPLAPRPTGDAVFNYPSSMTFAPCVSMPLLSVQGLPVGVQLMGQQHEDARMTALARWMLGAVSPVCA